jgi:hypothetical protein
VYSQEMDALKLAATDLNAASNALTEKITGVETQLKAMNIGIEHWVNWETRTFTGTIWLGYVRLSGDGWRIAIKYNEDIWAFNGAPRALRIVAIQALPTLLTALKIEAQKLISELRGAIDAC